MIFINNVTKKYKTNKETVVALDDLTLQFSDKGLVYITGESGSGKSTLLNVISSLDDIDSGDIIVNNKSIIKLKKEEARYYRQQYIGIVFQQFNLITEMTVYNNIKIVNDLFNKDDKEIEKLLKLLKIESLKNKKINELSGGEQQRVAIARALIKKPKILLCDEPTGMLDKENSKLIFELLKEISKETLVIVVTHDIDLAQEYSNNIIKLSKGKLISSSINNNETNNEQIKFEKNKNISFKNITKISLSWLKIKMNRMITMSIILFILLVTIISTLSFYYKDDVKIILDAIYDNNINYISYSRVGYCQDDKGEYYGYATGMNDKDYKYFQNNYKGFDGDVVHNYYKSKYGNLLNNKGIYSYFNGSYSCYYTNTNNGLVVINNEFIKKYNMKLYGSLPKNENEIVLTKYVFEQYQYSGYDDKIINEFDDFIGEEIWLEDDFLISKKTFKVVGILDTKLNYERYKKLSSRTASIENDLIQKEWDFIMRYGLHNVGYVHRSFISNLKSNYLLNCRFKQISGSLTKMFHTGLIDAKECKKIYYLDDSKRNSTNGIIFPLNFNMKGNKYLYDEYQNCIKKYALSSFDKIKDEFIKKYPSSSDSWQSYYNYIQNNEDNEFDPSYNRAYFKEESIKNYMLDSLSGYVGHTSIQIELGSNKIISKKVEILGAYDVDDPIKFNGEYPFYISGSLMKEIINEFNDFRPNYGYFVNPLNKNYNLELKNIKSFSEEKFDNGILRNELNEKYVNYENGNEFCSYLDYINYVYKYIMIVSLIISLILILVLILLIFYHFSDLIKKQIKDIGILYSLGTSKNEIFKIFSFQLYLILASTFISSIIGSSILNIIINIILKFIFNSLITFININWLIILLSFIICILISEFIIYILISKYDRRSPIKIILSLT